MCRYAQFTLSSRQLNYRGFPLIFLKQFFIHPVSAFTFMRLPVDLTGTCIHTSFMCTVHKCQLPAAIILHGIFTTDCFAVIHRPAEAGDKFFFYFHFGSSAGASAAPVGVISSSIPVSLYASNCSSILPRMSAY